MPLGLQTAHGPTDSHVLEQAFLLPSGEQVAQATGREQDEIDQVSGAAKSIAGPDIDLQSGTPPWLYLLVEAERIGRETEPGHFEEGEGLGPVGARIVAETLIGLIVDSNQGSQYLSEGFRNAFLFSEPSDASHRAFLALDW